MDAKALVNQPPHSIQRLILLTDGTVMSGQDKGDGKEHYYRLSPDAFGDYSEGKWTAMAAPKGFSFRVGDFPASAVVLASGSVLFCGQDATNPKEPVVVAVYDPTAKTVAAAWSKRAASPGTGNGNTSDVTLCELADGKVLCNLFEGPGFIPSTAIFDPYAPAGVSPWSTPTPTPDGVGTGGWLLMPDGSVISAVSPRTLDPGGSIWRFTKSDGWHFLDLDKGEALYGSVLLHTGHVLCVDLLNRLSLYTPPDTWVPGPTGSLPALPNPYEPPLQISACLTRSGAVLLVLPVPAGADVDWQLWEGDANSFVRIAGPNIPKVDDNTQMLPLPNGQVLVSGSQTVVLTPAPQNLAWAPSNLDVVSELTPGGEMPLGGKHLGGFSQAVNGPVSSPTNFPLVRIKNLKSQHVFYCRTHDHTAKGHPSMGVATAAMQTLFDPPDHIEIGDSELCVIANGIATCRPIKVVKPEKALQRDLEGIKLIIEHDLKEIVENVRQVDQGDPANREIGEAQEWIRVVQQLAQGTEKLQREVQRLRSFIRADERPVVGEIPVDVPKGKT